MSGRRFPVMVGYSGGFSIPWELVEPFERQALANHGRQTLERLAERGGLDPTELWAVMHCRDCSDSHNFPTKEAALEWARSLVDVNSALTERVKALEQQVADLTTELAQAEFVANELAREREQLEGELSGVE